MKLHPCKYCGELLEIDDWFYLVNDDKTDRIEQICKNCHDSQYGKSKEEQEEDEEFWNGIFESKMAKGREV